MTRIALATCRDLPRLTPDDRILRDELLRYGFEVETALWNAEEIRWNSFDLVMIRSCWDYHLHCDRFLSWAEDLDRTGVTLWNPLPVVCWNAHKRYLRDLQAAGVAVVPTCWPTAGAETLSDIFRRTGWNEAVVKPAVSASAHQTWRVGRDEAVDHENELARALEQGEVMVQRYLPEITGQGEWSLIFLDGAFSHAALKLPKPGDFRVQPDFGGTVIRGEPSPSLIAVAEQAFPGQDDGSEVVQRPSVFVHADVFDVPEALRPEERRHVLVEVAGRIRSGLEHFQQPSQLFRREPL